MCSHSVAGPLTACQCAPRIVLVRSGFPFHHRLWSASPISPAKASSRGSALAGVVSFATTTACTRPALALDHGLQRAHEAAVGRIGVGRRAGGANRALERRGGVR